MLVKMSNGSEVNFASAVSLMDDEIRESVHNFGCAQTEQEFLAAYERLHLARFGVPFVVN